MVDALVPCREVRGSNREIHSLLLTNPTSINQLCRGAANGLFMVVRSHYSLNEVRNRDLAADLLTFRQFYGWLAE